ncbi:MAG: patatin-like phospholipase family protein [Bacteroidota bacterium]|nr:patatin-like phospholipase family protein [Bacteroidota bacterium]
MRVVRKFGIFLLLVLALSNIVAQDTLQRKKVALVLSGGGAKGSAHIGALKIIEQAGIPIDMIVGTSMGALMGGLYSIGYTADMLDSLVRVQDWSFLLSDRVDNKEQYLLQRKRGSTYIGSVDVNHIGRFALGKPGFIKGKNLANLFSKLTLGYHDSIDFNSLPIAFACVATNMVDFSEVDFHSGNLATAMRASMSIPAVFTPVKLGDKILVDGGLKNNFPVDIAKQMGADIIIGVTVQDMNNRKAEDFNSTLTIINQLMDVNTTAKFEENKNMCDVFIRVNVEGYSAASFNAQAIDTLVQRGEDAARTHLQEILDLKQQLGMSLDSMAERITPYRMLNQKIRMKIGEVTFNHIEKRDEDYLRERFNLNNNATTTLDTIEKAMTSLRSTLFYNDASYQIKYLKNGYGIDISSEGKKTAELFLGIRFDNEEQVSMQVEGEAPVNFLFPMMLKTTLRLGKRSMFNVQSNFDIWRMYSVNLSYMFRHQDLNIYYHADRDLNPDYQQHQVNFSFANVNLRNFLLNAFLRWDYFMYSNLLYGKKSNAVYLPTSHLWSYHIKIGFDDRDKEYFATMGGIRYMEYALYTDNFYQYNEHAPLHTFSYKFMETFDLKHNWFFSPMFYGRSIYGEDMPTVLSNCIGGEYFSHYVEQQLPFAGVDNLEIIEKNFIALDLQLRKQLWKNNYFTFAYAMGYKDDKLQHLFSSSPLWGVRLSYSYNSIIGPVGASMGYSNRTKEPYLFINIGYEF